MDNNRNTRLKIALLSVYLVTASLNAITANIPEMAKTFSTVPLYVIELIATIPSLFQMLGVLCGSAVTNRISHKNSVLLGLLMCGVGGTVPLLIQNFVLLFITRCLFGLGCGLISSVMLAMLIHFFTGETRSTMIGLTGSVGGLGSALSSFAAGQLLAFGWHVSFAVYFTAFAVFALILVFVPSVPRQTADKQATRSHAARRSGWAALTGVTLLSFTSTLLATFFIIKSSTLITETGIGTAQDGSLAITFFSLGSLLAGAMYGKLYARLRAKALVLFYIVSALGLFSGLMPSLPVVYAGSVLIGWGLIAFTPYFQEKASRDFSDFGKTATTCILVSQALGAFVAPYYGNILQAVTPVLTSQFAVTGGLYLVLAVVAAAMSLRRKTA